ncbi:RNA polymerase sigma factor [Aliikangiella coralliicola]|uniref:Sigma-70 family RNA polymerase sigma factor n=1 Tax=Aliikangiella coralliicola TaxID=2592383 RepID=A0A545U8V9_9GAMM|nr:sigma-70 family RNA polymerase sigma factor [Aliikangiella coralliicola]TQV85899.1 sigma-70 family RNA polymerase sigma factor [Aliikangiella coralliicola]
MHETLLQSYKEHRQELLAFLRKRLPDSAIADDLLQELYLKLERYSTEKVIAMPRAYLYRAANNLVADYFRQQARLQKKQELEFDNAVEERTPDRILEQQQRIRLLAEALTELPEKCQQAFRWHRVEQLAKTEVAERLGVSVNMVEKHIRKALEHCHRRIFEAQNE